MRIRRLLIANRGEIAVRIIRACRELGIDTVAVHSTVDAAAPFVALADRAYAIGPAPAAESYLKIPTILDVARQSGADAIHPGYGFLAENAAFAQACAEMGLVFVGPPASAMEQMGSKLAARDLMQRAGVPVVPGARPADQTEEGIRAAAREVGVPLLIKASAGGGGKGMRTVRDEAELDEAIAAARREAIAAFGDGTLYVERLVERPRHIELQILADRHGGIVHLFERECSVQRRHQKVIEETPSPALTPTLRAKMGEAAVAAARAVGYENAGTIEFLLEGDGDAARFYFLEMNTRLQVEHPITEEVVGVDLVRTQLAVAAGEPLPWTQSALTQRGHAIECRVYAEDPRQQFLPQAGRLLVYREPRGPGIRVDGGVQQGGEVSVHYDPLLAKLVTRAESRSAAIDRAVAALKQFAVLGLRTNVAFLIRVLQHDRFRAGEIDTGFLDTELASLIGSIDDEGDEDDGARKAKIAMQAAVAAAAWRAAQPRTRSATARTHANAMNATNATADANAMIDATGLDATGTPLTAPDPWDTLEGWRG
jgi:acetyl-CoA carboxylase biotin carboxylase subunit